jgi:glyceraldehyde-3-phosphate dehydrogenase/erythrose-4-phosphate dehydrogenase
MSEYIGLIHSNGPDELVVESGGKITAAGTQAAHIADAADAAGAAPTAEEYATVVAKLNAVLAALEGVGILASS